MRMSNAELAETLYKVFKGCLGLLADWATLRQDVQVAWVKTGLAGKQKAEAAGEVNVRDLAGCMRETFLTARAFKDERPGETEALTWQALARHLLAILDAEEDDLDEETLPQFEASWGPWVLREQRRLKEAREKPDGQDQDGGGGDDPVRREAKVSDAGGVGGDAGHLAPG